MKPYKFGFAALWLGGVLLVPPIMSANAPRTAVPLRALIVGGGPELSYNQVAIESNVRYVGKLLPPDTLRTTLFADGSPDSPTVLYETDSRALSDAEQLFTLVFDGSESGDESPNHYRKPNLGTKLDGPSNPEGFQRVFSQIVTEEEKTPAPLFLYFTGHGSPGDRRFENNLYDMWGKKSLSVRQLAASLARLPENVPVTVIMVQCHSGAFGNLLFEGGIPDNKPVSRDIAGFFASTADRVAAGCTSEVDEAEYRDFTSYFFAALTGRDRLGRKVTGSDYNKDGHVGMNEAFAYTLANDRSIDAPVCTSDIFLRRVVSLREKEIFATRFSDIEKWATPAQHYALNSLAKELHRETGENRLSLAYRQLFPAVPIAETRTDARTRELQRNWKDLQRQARRTLLARWPELVDSAETDYKLARKQAIAYLQKNADSATWKALREASINLNKIEAEAEAQEVAEAHLLRFLMLSKSIVLAHRLRQTGDTATKARFERLVEAEGRILLSPASTL